tara:strand:- start:511 stop:1272 length:762 start_codon:yes stop_codon:yes gene_type:complete
MRRPFIAGNWKMNLGVEAAGILATNLAKACKDIRDVDIAVAPTEVCLTTVIQALSESGIHVASQNHYPAVKGAYTGEVSPVMLREAGCAYALVGHSERRTLFGETNTQVQQKVLAAFDAGLLPILCIGETLDEREAGNAESVVQEQLLTAIQSLDAAQVSSITIAYEPVWAIGTGKTASPAEAQSMHAFIRGLLRERYPSFVAEDIRIQYGGSVKPHNAQELLSQPDIDGALVGGASLTVDSFVGILTAVSKG